LSADQMLLASVAAQTYKLAMADAIIWQTAQVHQAKLFTQDDDLKGLPNVKFKAKLHPPSKVKP
jgi:predicted nucleic acid-binding protein